MSKIIGLTGGIGSGKSTIAQFFIELGVPVYIADSEAKKIMNYPETIFEVQTIFNQNVILESGKLDRKKIASIVFNNPEKLKELNAIIHPKVNQDFKEWLKKQEDYSYVIKEVAIIFETQSEKHFDKIILVTAPENLRIERVSKRDNSSQEEIMERIQNQLPDAIKIKKSDYIIQNISIDTVKQEVQKLHHILNSL